MLENESSPNLLPVEMFRCHLFCRCRTIDAEIPTKEYLWPAILIILTQRTPEKRIETVRLQFG
uniref:Uncharacterized protein n=1 Tax=Romanomermis culicivorax TaxID=13658 RepID=A0A915JB37_ROMCU